MEDKLNLKDCNVQLAIGNIMHYIRQEAKKIEDSQKSTIELWLEKNEEYCNYWDQECFPLSTELFFDINPYRLAKALTNGTSMTVGGVIDGALKKIYNILTEPALTRSDAKYYEMTREALKRVSVRFGSENLTSDNAKKFIELCDGVISEIWNSPDRLKKLEFFYNGPKEISMEKKYEAMDRQHIANQHITDLDIIRK